MLTGWFPLQNLPTFFLDEFVTQTRFDPGCILSKKQNRLFFMQNVSIKKCDGCDNETNTTGVHLL
jgi:hypothetical protein